MNKTNVHKQYECNDVIQTLMWICMHMRAYLWKKKATASKTGAPTNSLDEKSSSEGGSDMIQIHSFSMSLQLHIIYIMFFTMIAAISLVLLAEATPSGTTQLHPRITPQSISLPAMTKTLSRTKTPRKTQIHVMQR